MPFELLQYISEGVPELTGPWVAIAIFVITSVIMAVLRKILWTIFCVAMILICFAFLYFNSGSIVDKLQERGINIKDQVQQQIESGDYQETVSKVVEDSGTVFEFFK